VKHQEQGPGRGLRLAIAGGGTGGHLFPALAIAEAWEDGGYGEVLFVGAEDGLESRLLPPMGKALVTLPVGRIKGGTWTARVRTMLGLPAVVWRAVKVLERFRPHVVLGVGGYASAPAVVAARLMNIPTVLHEQNARPGLTNRWLSRLTREVLLSFPSAGAAFEGRSTTLTGNPVRTVFHTLAAEMGRDEEPGPEPEGSVSVATLGRDRPLRLLVFGGSQGAHVFTRVVPPAIAQLRARGLRIQLRQQARSTDVQELRTFYRQARIAAEVTSFFHDMVSTYREADLVICRAGATTVAELALLGKPALLVPYPFAADDHQTANAMVLVEGRGGWMQPQETFTSEWLCGFLETVCSDAAGLRTMGNRAREVAYPDAARTIVDRLARYAPGTSAGEHGYV
jgi:UDP-N-acetylglucosamine--N-acetylmuramyl-(pentapeptide) pyrophosphoryl-undecaprenol N-acetylglucosamine transferase